MNQKHHRTMLLVLTLVLSSVAIAAEPNSPVDAEALIRQFHANYSSNNVEKNGELVDEHIVVNLNGGAANKVNGATLTGRQAFVEWLKRDKVMFPDGKLTDHEIIAQGNRAAVRFTLNGTHGGPIPTPTGELSATNRPVVIEATEFFTFNDAGKLVRLETFTNDLGLMGQVTAK